MKEAYQERVHTALRIAREALADRRLDVDIVESGQGFRIKLILRDGPAQRYAFVRDYEDWQALKSCWQEL
jgi:hypothetical protein